MLRRLAFFILVVKKPVYTSIGFSGITPGRGLWISDGPARLAGPKAPSRPATAAAVANPGGAQGRVLLGGQIHGGKSGRALVEVELGSAAVRAEGDARRAKESPRVAERAKGRRGKSCGIPPPRTISQPNGRLQWLLPLRCDPCRRHHPRSLPRRWQNSCSPCARPTWTRRCPRE